MSWSTVRAAILARLQAISTAATTKFNAQSRLRWTNDNPDGAEFQAMLCAGTPLRLSCAQVTRKARRSINAIEDARRRIQHDVEITFNLAEDDADSSENLFQDLLDAAAENFDAGDRTLGGVAKTSGDPEVSQIQIVIFCKCQCHEAKLTFTVEEVLA